MITNLSKLACVLILFFVAGSTFAQGQSQNIGHGKIPGQFIVTVNADADPEEVARDHGINVQFIYRHAINGFTGSASELAHDGLMGDRRVRTIEEDAVTSAISISWGQDRIDQRHLPLNGTYTKNYTGLGVTAYVIDCGIMYSHQEFGGRAKFGFDVFGSDGSDHHFGHGTHVAGTIGGATIGVAPGVTLISVRVIDSTGSGTVSGLISGIDWVIANHVSPAVANISIGAGLSSSLNTAVTNLMAAGVVTCVAAGNRSADASTASPSSAPDVITVGATDNTDAKASYSNYGSVIDLFAPGSGIYSAYDLSTSSYANMSGTSMAAPHVAGVCALELQHYPTLAALAIRDSICAHATKGIVTSALSANNNLLYSLEQNDTGGAAVANIPPAANFSVSINNLNCTFTDKSTDQDGKIAGWYWTFGDGGTSTVQNPSYSYLNAGTYSVNLKVTDNSGATTSTTQSVTVSAAPAPPPGQTSYTINLTASGYKSKGYDFVNLKWSGATTSYVDIYRNNIKIATVANGGSITDATGIKGAATLTYKVYNTDGTGSSPGVTVTF
jgi:subtilisin family serine protease